MKTPEEQREYNRQKMAKWRAENPERSREQGRKSKAKQRERDPEHQRNLCNESRERHLDERRAKDREYDAKLFATDPERARERRGKWQRNNPELSREYQKEWRAKNATYLRNYHFKKNYGITLEQYLEMLEQQEGRCAACLELFPDNETPYLDHCHKTGKVRGIVHMRCNMALGYVKDDPMVLRRLADYLERHMD